VAEPEHRSGKIATHRCAKKENIKSTHPFLHVLRGALTLSLPRKSFFVLPDQNVLETMCARWHKSIFQRKRLKHSWALWSHGSEGADISYLNHMVLKTFQSGYGRAEIAEARREKFGSPSFKFQACWAFERHFFSGALHEVFHRWFEGLSPANSSSFSPARSSAKGPGTEP